jgi:hypothetical protein
MQLADGVGDVSMRHGGADKRWLALWEKWQNLTIFCVQRTVWICRYAHIADWVVCDVYCGHFVFAALVLHTQLVIVCVVCPRERGKG